MNEHDLQNEKLDQIGRKLLKTARLSADEIEKIVAAPRLFDSVLKRIETEKQLKSKTERSSIIASIAAFLYRQKAFGAFGILTFLLIGAALYAFKKPVSSELVEQSVKPETEQKFPTAENLVQSPEIEKAKFPETKNPIRNEKVTFKPEKSKVPNRARKQPSTRQSRAERKQQPEVFYSLSAFGTWAADGEVLQIVRAEISRSELFALGVNLAVENESEKVKTDLLVGGDGVARAIRFVE